MAEKKDYTAGTDQSSTLLVALASIVAVGLSVLVARTAKDRKTLLEAAAEKTAEQA